MIIFLTYEDWLVYSSTLNDSKYSSEEQCQQILQGRRLARSRKLLSAIERLHNNESDSWAQFARHYLTADQPLSTMCKNQLIVVDSSPPISKVSEIRELG